MKLIIDSNRLFAALIKDSTAREILFEESFEFFAPEFIKVEFEKYKSELIDKVGLSEERLDLLFSTIFGFVNIIPENELISFIKEFKEDDIDPKYLSYLAACLKIKADGIWTHDPHFFKQEKIKVFTNIDLLKMISKNEK